MKAKSNEAASSEAESSESRVKLTGVDLDYADDDGDDGSDGGETRIRKTRGKAKHTRRRLIISK